jgi:mRNA interferase MazF
MDKEFDEWNVLKKELHTKEEDPKRFHDREIWWCSLGINIGVEQDGRNEQFLRPVLIIKRYNEHMALVAPLTRTQKTTRYYHSLTVKSVRDSRVVLSQLRTISSKRLYARMARVPEPEFRLVCEKLIALNFGGVNVRTPPERGSRA